MMPQLIETMRVDETGQLPLLARHIDRLIGASIALGYACPEEALLAAIQAKAAELPQGGMHRLRLLLDRQGSFELTAAPLAPLPPGQRVALSPRCLNSDTLLLRYKTTHRPWFAEASQWLEQHPDHFDVLFLNEHGQLCEGSRTNVYLLLDGEWVTPPVDAGLLPGVQRAEILEAGQATERLLTVEDLQRAEGIRLSNALRGWFDVTLQCPGEKR